MTQDGLWAAAVAADVSCVRAVAVQRQIRLTKAARAMQRCGDVMLRAVNRSFLGYDDQDDTSRRASRRLDQCGGLLHDRPRRAVSLCQKRLDLGRRERLDLQLRLVRVGAKFTIGERGVEGAPQRG